MTPTEHVGIAELFIDWKKKCSENAKMKVFIERFANGKRKIYHRKRRKTF
jgi:hypothetical protein